MPDRHVENDEIVAASLRNINLIAQRQIHRSAVAINNHTTIVTHDGQDRVGVGRAARGARSPSPGSGMRSAATPPIGPPGRRSTGSSPARRSSTMRAISAPTSPGTPRSPAAPPPTAMPRPIWRRARWRSGASGSSGTSTSSDGPASEMDAASTATVTFTVTDRRADRGRRAPRRSGSDRDRAGWHRPDGPGRSRGPAKEPDDHGGAALSATPGPAMAAGADPAGRARRGDRPRGPPHRHEPATRRLAGLRPSRRIVDPGSAPGRHRHDH